MGPQTPTVSFTSTIVAEPQAQASGSPSRMYALQVRAFIEAAEVVDADPDVIEEILDGFDGVVEVDEEGGDEEIESQNPAGNGKSDSNQALSDEVDQQFVALVEEGRSNYWRPLGRYLLRAIGENAWSKVEVKQMMFDLKEQGSSYFINKYVVTRAIPIPKLLYAFDVVLCPELRNKSVKTLTYFLQVVISRELQARDKLPMYNTVDDAVNLIKNSRNILVLTGAGISVSCGIPDFRSRDGLYAKLQDEGKYELDDPQQMFDIQYFKENPSVFYSFASQIYPSNFIPSPCHRFIKTLEDKGKLLRNYTQNIDTLETLAGVQNVLQCHGSFATASCINCRTQVPGSAIEADIMKQVVPICHICATTPLHSAVKKKKKKGKKKKNASPWESDGEEEPDISTYPSGIMKPDITFFGEKLTDDFDKALVEDRPRVDLLLVIGTSLKVSPVSDIISHLPHSVPQILINKTPVRHVNPDIVLLGNADDIIRYLCWKLSWDLPSTSQPSSAKLAPDRLNLNLRKRSSDIFLLSGPERVGHSHIWLFEGAEGGKWVENIQNSFLESQPPLYPRSDSSQVKGSSAEPQSKKARTK